ncbi:MarC family protein [Amaricoccus sp.]|uniref:MarC family protein n=1 Tax=Amaricoccus sp. TaxID=1872485 RepID=UPI001B63BAB3|nr:MarC family protein [Amaricoccus sp.]MBP7241964.1 MarC family protein [Amaricoccus sp.]
MSFRDALLAFLSLAAIVNPIALAPAFAALTAGRPPAETRRIATRAVLLGFALIAAGGQFGHAALKGLGADAPLVHLVVGGALVAMGTAMLFGPGEAVGAAPRPRRDPSVVPLAVPLVAGPGAIGAMVMLVSRHAGQTAAVVQLYGILAVVGALTWASFRGADAIARRLGPRGMRLVVRGLGLVLIVVAARFLYEGLAAYGLLGRRAS